MQITEISIKDIERALNFPRELRRLAGKSVRTTQNSRVAGRDLKVEFSRRGPGHYAVSFTVDGKHYASSSRATDYTVTKAVLVEVIATIYQFILRKKPKRLEFTAEFVPTMGDTQGRQRLYNTLMSRFKPYLEEQGYTSSSQTVHQDNYVTVMQYTIERLQTQ